MPDPLQPARRDPQWPHGAHAVDPELEALVREIIGRIADKWTMLVIEALAEQGCLRFTQLAAQVGNVSQKMLTKTVRQMEADGLLTRTVYPVVPPKVEYRLTEMGMSLGEAFCGVWLWAERHRETIEASRRQYQAAAEAAARQAC
ncbi:transcriptional regulator [Pseudomonas sp. v388]|uniref:winged helix-turn-helix transcriptional regulator n=1 Tax=Pseudomonas sp. v388 TaxID=2479849 RepID=UPI000F781FD2|nr:helix-turn-helix domain-containing protein [Pseudomonas sp. v388]RRV10806.1 transcriptional regulator [Pseudomonas sp. v388]